ncbi:MAG: hypothetical protein HY908_00270 [Myxococcales bacterium]|nr:hypothetical protein [Myxococcales bacterium]
MGTWHREVAEACERAASASASAWRDAVAAAERGDDPGAVELCRADARACRLAYESARAALERADYGAVRGALLEALGLELGGCGDAHARRALAVLGVRAVPHDALLEARSLEMDYLDDGQARLAARRGPGRGR